MATPRVSKTQETLDLVKEIKHAQALHFQSDLERDRKTEDMYKILVTGNGLPSLQDRVRQLERWVDTEKKVLWYLITPLLLAIGGGMVWLIVKGAGG